MTAMAAVDLGAQSGRVAVGTFDGDRLSVSETHRFANTTVEEDGVLRWDFERLCGNALDGLRAASRESELRSVGVDAWAVDFGLVDDDGALLANPLHYRDARRGRAVEAVYSRIPSRELYGRTGIQLMPINTVFELAAMADEDDPALREGRALLLIPDLVNHRLCGAATTERTNASTTQCLDAATGGWATDLLERLDVPTGILPEVIEPGTPLGSASPAAGIGGAEVIAVATHDTGSAVAAVPFSSPDAAFLSVGTWSLVGVELDRPVITDASFAANLTNEAGVAGTYRVLRNVTGLWLLHECRRAWGDQHSFEDLIDLARSAPALGPLIDPDDPSFAEPTDMPARIAEFCDRTGQRAPAGVGATVRCVLESIALRHAEVVELLGDVTGRAPTVLHVVGGGARNDLLCRWTADASGLPVVAGPEEATLVGNLLVQAIALGELASPAEGREVVRRSFDPRRYEPSGKQDWAEARDRFARLSDERPAVRA